LVLRGACVAALLHQNIEEVRYKRRSKGDTIVGVGKEWASQIKEQQERKEAKSREAFRRAEICAKGAPQLWERLQTAVEEIVREFAAELPAAKGLRSDRLNGNNLTVQTIAFPIIKVEILRTLDDAVQSRILELPQGLAEPRIRQSNKIWFTVGNDDQVYFTDGSRLYTPETLAKEFMMVVFDFFKQLRKVG
jgi:hypothetical protein